MEMAMATPTMRVVPHANDVFFGKGNDVYINNHPGNQRFRSLVAAEKERFANVVRSQKRVIATNIMNEIYRQYPAGRFLIEDPNTKQNGNNHSLDRVWIVVEHEDAMAKVMRRLREKGRQKKAPGESGGIADGTLHHEKARPAASKESPNLDRGLNDRNRGTPSSENGTPPVTVSSPHLARSTDNFIMSVQDWTSLSGERLSATLDYLQSSVILAGMVLKAGTDRSLRPQDISSNSVAIFLDQEWLYNPSGLPSLKAVEFRREASHVAMVLHPNERPAMSSREMCAALGEILLEIFTKGQSSSLGLHSGEVQSAMARNILLSNGMPLSICRLVCDLLDASNEPCPSSALITLEEALWDVSQMQANPQAYLYDQTCLEKAKEETHLFDNANDNHVFGREVKFIEEHKGSTLNHLATGDLSTEDVVRLTATKLCLPPRYVKDLAAVVWSKTRGDPSCVEQFLQSIIQNGMLSFSGGRWIWDCDVIEMQLISENMVALLVSRLNELPPPLMKALEILSCVGCQFEDETIEKLNAGHQILSHDIHSEMALAVEKGYLEKAGPVYQYTHDDLQQAIYDRMSASERLSLHKKIGETLLESSADTQSVLLAVDQLNIYCKDGDLSSEERLKYAGINAAAAKHSMGICSLEQTQSYISTGMKLLEPKHWESHHSLTSDLRELSATISHLQSDDRVASSQPASLPSTLPLRDWILQSNRHKASHIQGAEKQMKKDFLEKGTRVALSLARKLENDYQRTGSATFRDEDIVIENVIVTNPIDGEADFVRFSTPLNSQDSLHRSQRSAIQALGHVFYEIFTQEMLPSTRTGRPSFSEPSIFDVALKVTGDDDSRSNEGRAKRKQPRKLSGDNQGHYATLQRSGLPPSLCRLVADMIEKEDIFCSDQSIASLSDVVSDLQQMVDKPTAFLHDSLATRLIPIIPDTLYGRDDELRQCLEVANAVASGPAESENYQLVQMISGPAGTGKSRLAIEVRDLLETKKGWQCLQCKFNTQEVRPRPLSTITTAFDRFLEYIVLSRGHEDVKARLAKVFDNADTVELSRLIPALTQFVDTNAPCPKMTFGSGDAAASKIRLHRLFGLLTKALSNHKQPLLFFADDLQFSDTASLELIRSILEGMTVNSETSAGNERGPNMLFVGCYRSDEVECSGLATFLEELKSCISITVKELQLEGLSSEHVNEMVSDSLSYPRRLTRSLADLIHSKAAGSALFAKEFLSTLASENLLTYSLSQHKWLYDEDVIRQQTVSDGVVDLLTRRLQRLPEGVLICLQVMSCIGTEVPMETLLHLKNVCGILDIVAGLGCAAQELLIKKNLNDSYSFVHDMIQHTAYQGIAKQERVQMLKEIADTLVARTPESRSDAVLFIIVDLINRVGPENVSKREDRVRYAKLSLAAAENGIRTPDFDSAFVYLEAGISFLSLHNDSYWKENYPLSLALFNNAAFVHWTLGKTDLMRKRIDEVLANTEAYEDKLDSFFVLVRTLGMSGDVSAMEEACNQVFAVLDHLGEPFPKDPDDECIGKEVMGTVTTLKQLDTPLDQLPIMEDREKKEAMRFLMMLLIMSMRRKSRYLPLVGCRMVRLTLSHGREASSALGLAGVAISVAKSNITAAYQLGKAAMNLNRSPGCFSPEVAYSVISYVNAWKEPWQSSIPLLFEAWTFLQKRGEVTPAGVTAMTLAHLSFFSGSSLATLAQEVESFLRVMSRQKRFFFYMFTVPIANAICDLSGCTLPNNGMQGLEDDDKNLSKALAGKELLLAESIANVQIVRCIIFRRMDAAVGIVRKHHEFFKQHESQSAPVNTIVRTFYTGLLACHCLRQKKDQYWMDIALDAVKAAEKWVEGCKWTFEHKAYLLSAEYHYSIGDFDKAAEKYNLAVTSAHDHRFANEEALACELASYFHSKMGRNDMSSNLLKKAVDCYQSWGATKKAEALLQSLQASQ